MEMPKNGCRDEADALAFYWLAFLLTGDRDISIEIAADAAVEGNDSQAFVQGRMKDGRHLTITKAIATMRAELSESGRRTKNSYSDVRVPSLQDKAVSTSITAVDLERAVLAIDVFPRAVLLLLVFEGLSIAEAGALLDADTVLLASAQVVGLRELCFNMASTPEAPFDGARCSPYSTSIKNRRTSPKGRPDDV
jgi:hypothetical protein